MEALTVRRVPYSHDLAKQGDYVFIPKREPIRRYEPIDGSPKGFWAKLGWRLNGKKPLVKEVLESLWPEYDAIIVNCATCNQPVATSKDHKIISVEPLTIDNSITCPYCRTVTFKVNQGKLITA